MDFTRPVVSLLLCLALPGCYVKTYGLQASGGGANATVVSSQTVATTGFSNGRAAFSFGQPVSPSAPGGQVAFGRGGGLFIAVGLMVADAVQYVGDLFTAGPQPVAQRQSIADTCSCYRNSEEVMK